jgi:hypothetical protein
MTRRIRFIEAGLPGFARPIEMTMPPTRRRALFGIGDHHRVPLFCAG